MASRLEVWARAQRQAKLWNMEDIVALIDARDERKVKRS
jgi:hypothetical protein